METLIPQVAEKTVTQARDLKPGDIISQDYLDTNRGQQERTSRDIRLDRVQSTYMVYLYEGRSYLVPVVLLQGWDMRKGRGVQLACAASWPWTTMRLPR